MLSLRASFAFVSKGARRQAEWTYRALALAVLLNGTGCLRFAYNDVDRPTGPARDAGMDAGASQNLADASSQMDAQPTAAGRSGNGGTGRGGAAGSAGRSGGGPGPNGGSGSITDAAVDVGDAGAPDASLLRDAGSIDAAAPAAGSGGGGGSSGAGVVATPFASCASATGVLFCNGFEEAMPWVPKQPWSYDLVMNGQEARSTNTKYAGTAALHMSTVDDTTGTEARIADEHLNGKKTGDAWLRYYYYVPSSVTVSTYFSSGVMSEVVSPYHGFSLLIHTSSISIESMSVAGSAGFSFPRDRWVCVEMHVSIDSINGFFEIYTDGVRRILTGNGNTIPATGWTAAEVGIHYVGTGQGPVNVYADNVVVSTARYGCD